ncbi:MAG: aminopeptidase, partial [Gammaproteobacteria bacterium]
RDEELKKYQKRLEQRTRLIRLISDTRGQLAKLYAEDLSAKLKRQQKKQILDELRDEYVALRDRDQAPNWGRWFDRDLNNAKLAAVGTYHDQTEFFEDLFQQANEDFSAFYRLVEAQ